MDSEPEDEEEPEEIPEKQEPQASEDDSVPLKDFLLSLEARIKNIESYLFRKGV